MIEVKPKCLIHNIDIEFKHGTGTYSNGFLARCPECYIKHDIYVKNIICPTCGHMYYFNTDNLFSPMLCSNPDCQTYSARCNCIRETIGKTIKVVYCNIMINKKVIFDISTDQHGEIIEVVSNKIGDIHIDIMNSFGKRLFRRFNLN